MFSALGRIAAAGRSLDFAKNRVDLTRGGLLPADEKHAGCMGSALFKRPTVRTEDCLDSVYQ